MNGILIVEGALDTVYFFLYFLLTVQQIWMSFSLNLLHPKGNHPSKFQLVGVCRFGGVREQTNKQTDSLTDWHFYRVIVDIKNKIWKGNSINLCFKNFCFQTRLSSDVPLEHYHRKI